MPSQISQCGLCQFADTPGFKDDRKGKDCEAKVRTMQATHFRMAEGVDAGLTNSAVRLLSWVRMGSKLVVSFATDGPAAPVVMSFGGEEGEADADGSAVAVAA